jgi:type IV secretion system protein VirB3
MSTVNDLPGFEVPLHRSLTEPILLGGAPRTVAIANGTLAAAVGLGLQLWIPGVVLWIVGHSLAVWGGASIRSSCRCSPSTSSTSRCWTCDGRTPRCSTSPNTASVRPCSPTGCRGPVWSRPASC